MKKYLAEFIGTFGLVFCGTGAVIVNDVIPGSVSHVGIAITFGLIVMVMIYALGNISGAHLNPAVTIAFTCSGSFPIKLLFPYMLSQLAGAVSASAVLKFIFPSSALLGSTIPAGSDGQSFVLECILSFFLLLVIFGVAKGSKEQGLFAGIAIGGIVLLEAMFGGPVSGASMNPARSVGPAVVAGELKHLWIYIIAPVTGGLAATAVHKIIH